MSGIRDVLIRGSEKVIGHYRLLLLLLRAKKGRARTVQKADRA
jgi:hypothetical protein